MKDDITGDDYFVFAKIPDAIGFARIRVSHKEAGETFRVKFRSSVLFGIDVNRASKDAEMQERWFSLKPRLIGGTV